MNATRHDPDELRGALDALAEILSKREDLEQQRAILQKEIYRLDTQLNHARERAAKVLRREGGAVVHAGRSWRVNDHGYVSSEAVQVNLDAIGEVRRHQETELHLTPPPASEKAA